MGKFVITAPDHTHYHFVLKASNNQVVLSSETYNSKQAFEHGIQAVQDNSHLDHRFDRQLAVNHKFYFNLKAANGKVIGTSEMYDTADARDKGILAVKTAAELADVIYP